jgi:Bacterial Ig-like domain
VLVADPAAPHGQFLWLPDGGYPGNFNLPVKTQHRAEYDFVVPRSGNYRLRGLIRSTDFSSDSFFVEFDGNQALGTVSLWDTQPVGAPDYQWDYLNNRNGADPVVVNLAAGTRRVTVYARDDGTRLDRLELESVRPLVVLSGPAVPVSGPFQVNVSFSENVSGLQLGDFQLNGGTLGNLTGSGSGYQVVVTPSASAILLTLPENVVTDAEAAGNFASNPYSVSVLTPYQQWAAGQGIDGSPAGMIADIDHDGLGNFAEYAFGLDPKNGASSQAITSLPAPPSGIFTYTRRKTSLTGLNYSVWYSTNLTTWTRDTGAAEGATTVNGDVETVPVTLSNSLLANPMLFIQIKAE